MTISKEQQPDDQAQSDFRILAEYSADMICRVNLSMTYTYVSPSSRKVLGWTPEEMIAMEAWALVHPEDVKYVSGQASHHLQPGVEPGLTHVRMRGKDDQMRWMEVSARVIRDNGTGEPTEFILVMRDISERKSNEEKLAHLAMTDGLTNLANRRAFDESLELEWNRTMRDSSQVSLLLMDIDHFKRFNDRYGHQVGDDFLRTVARRVRETVRSSDIVARYGGEELAVILPGTDAAGASAAAEAVRSMIELLQIPNEDTTSGGGFISVSIGVATALSRLGGSMKMPESLIAAADNALYKAKAAGRNRVASAVLLAFQDPGQRELCAPA